MEKNIKKFVLLHSNDIHADFLSRESNDEAVGGIALLAGYLNKVRSEEENVVYVIAGDMFNGSVIDSEYKGISTLFIMNYLKPDAVCVGNHEMDYGISHTLFVEKCADFPLINANIYVSVMEKRLYAPYTIVSVAGLKVLFIGITTAEVARSLRNDQAIGSYIEVRDPLEEVERICNTYNADDIDAAVLLTHIGFDEDKKLAERIGSDVGVDLIIGGHSHTLLEKPVTVNGIPIVQVGWGTGHIGRFDIYYDTDARRIDHYTWTLVPVDEAHCEPDPTIAEYVEHIKAETDLKYQRVVCLLNHAMENSSRKCQTEVGSFFADVFKAACGVDIFMLSAGAFRGEKLGPVVSYENLIQIYPYSNEIYRLKVTGAQLRSMMLYMLGRMDGDNPRCNIQNISFGLQVVYARASRELKVFEYNGKAIEDEQLFTIGIGGYSYRSFAAYFGIPLAEVEKNQKARVIATSDQQILDEYLTELCFVAVPTTDRMILEP